MSKSVRVFVLIWLFICGAVYSQKSILPTNYQDWRIEKPNLYFPTYIYISTPSGTQMIKIAERIVVDTLKQKDSI